MKQSKFSKTINGVNFSGEMFKYYAAEADETPEQQAQYFLDTLSLTSGDVVWDSSHLSIDGISNGKRLKIEQDGEYEYGGPYDSKFKKPTIVFDGYNFFDNVLAAFEEYGGEIEKGNYIDVSRIDIYGYLFKQYASKSSASGSSTTLKQSGNAYNYTIGGL